MYEYNEMFRLPHSNAWCGVVFRKVSGGYTDTTNDLKTAYRVMNTVFNAIRKFSKEKNVTTFLCDPADEKRWRLYKRYLDHFGIKYEIYEYKILFWLNDTR